MQSCCFPWFLAPAEARVDLDCEASTSTSFVLFLLHPLPLEDEVVFVDLLVFELDFEEVSSLVEVDGVSFPVSVFVFDIL
jgi:hypothetical protein